MTSKWIHLRRSILEPFVQAPVKFSFSVIFLPPWHTVQTSPLIRPKESSVSVCFSCLVLQKAPVYPVLFPSGPMRKRRLFYLGLSRYILATGQIEAKSKYCPLWKWNLLVVRALLDMVPHPHLPLSTASPAEAQPMGQLIRPFCLDLLQPTVFKSPLCRGEVACQSGNRQPGTRMLTIGLSLSFLCDLAWVGLPLLWASGFPSVRGGMDSCSPWACSHSKCVSKLSRSSPVGDKETKGLFYADFFLVMTAL